MNILVVDGDNLAARMQYVFKEAATPDGFPTGALYGCVSGIRKAITVHGCEAVMFVRDCGVPRFRFEVCPEYKSQREDKRTPDDKLQHENRKKQLKVIHRLLTPIGVTTARAKGFEGDDTIAALVHAKLPKDAQITILSSDKDFTQLVTKDGRVRLWDPMKEEYRTHDAHYCLKRCLDPKQSDNLDGVPGIGEKKAELLIQAWELGGRARTSDDDGYLESFLTWCEQAGRSADPVGKLAKMVDTEKQKVRANWRCTWLGHTVADCSQAMKFRRPEIDRRAFKEVCREFRLKPLLEEISAIWPPFRDLRCPV